MSIIRLIHIKVDPAETAAAERLWKTECATLMIKQPGCLSEKLLRGRDSRRIHLVFGMGQRGGYRELHEQRCA